MKGGIGQAHTGAALLLSALIELEDFTSRKEREEVVEGMDKT